jgi:hypothetical protein
MNTLERRQLVRGHVVDVAVAKVAINKSRRERAEAAKDLRKAMAKKQFTAARRADSISYPQAS